MSGRNFVDSNSYFSTLLVEMELFEVEGIQRSSLGEVVSTKGE